jgi:hypothetical protein
MSTSDAERYELLLQNYKDLAAGVGMIREAVERAFDVRLLGATTMSGEFEIITRAIYAAAADRPRPARPTPVTNDKTDSRGRHTDRKVTLRTPYLTKNLSYPLPDQVRGDPDHHPGRARPPADVGLASGSPTSLATRL